MRMRILFVCCAALALTIGVATATAGGGNSENAKKCQKDGWQTVHRPDGSTFKSQDECVSYAANGGTLTIASISEYVYLDLSASKAFGVTGTGFTPNHDITLTATGFGPGGLVIDTAPNFLPVAATTASGTFDSLSLLDGVGYWYAFVWCPDGPQTIHFTATDGVFSASKDVAVSC